MDGLLSPEVEAEIRRAIVAKLEELNAYVDDELPAYIMVRVFLQFSQPLSKFSHKILVCSRGLQFIIRDFS